MVAIGAQETSSVTVETVAKYSKGHGNAAPVLPNFKSDATKVTSKGMGLKKAFLGKQNQFTINATEAGKSCCHVHKTKNPHKSTYTSFASSSSLSSCFFFCN